MSKILITGADGQLGNEFRKIAQDSKEFEFIFTDINELDISQIHSIEDFFSEQKLDYIVNCAAYTNVDKAETDHENAYLINAVSVKNLSKISKKYSIPVIHISTDYVFNGDSEIPYKETDKVDPVSVYGASKLAGEKNLENAYKYIIIRTAWLYSTFGHNFVKTMLRLGKGQEELNVVSDQIGSPTFAQDLAAAVMEIIKHSEENSDTFISGVYHYSNEGQCSWSEFASEIMKIANIKCKINPIPTSEFPTDAKRPKYSLLNKTKIKENFQISIPNWKDSLRECLIELGEGE